MLAEILTAIAIKAGSDALSAKAKDEMGLNQGSIGSSTRANPVTGPEIKTSEVGAEESSETKGSEITPFEYQIDEKMSPEQELMALLQQKEGIVAAADGTYLESSQNEELSGDMDEGFFDKISDWYDNLDENTQKLLKESLIGTGAGIVGGLAQKALGVEGKFSTGKAPTAGGTVGRPIVFNPVGRKSGGVLDRSMFTPMFHGGELDGPGGPKDDLIPVMASDGEFMLSKAAVDQAGGGNHNKGIARLTAFNNMGNRKYGN